MPAATPGRSPNRPARLRPRIQRRSVTRGPTAGVSTRGHRRSRPSPSGSRSSGRRLCPTPWAAKLPTPPSTPPSAARSRSGWRRVSPLVALSQGWIGRGRPAARPGVRHGPPCPDGGPGVGPDRPSSVRTGQPTSHSTRRSRSRGRPCTGPGTTSGSTRRRTPRRSRVKMPWRSTSKPAAAAGSGSGGGRQTSPDRRPVEFAGHLVAGPTRRLACDLATMADEYAGWPAVTRCGAGLAAVGRAPAARWRTPTRRGRWRPSCYRPARSRPARRAPGISPARLTITPHDRLAARAGRPFGAGQGSGCSASTGRCRRPSPWHRRPRWRPPGLLARDGRRVTRRRGGRGNPGGRVGRPGRGRAESSAPGVRRGAGCVRDGAGCAELAPAGLPAVARQPPTIATDGTAANRAGARVRVVNTGRARGCKARRVSHPAPSAPRLDQPGQPTATPTSTSYAA